MGPKANMIAIEKAKKYGSGWVSVSNTNHYGIAGYYSLEALKHGMIGYVCMYVCMYMCMCGIVHGLNSPIILMFFVAEIAKGTPCMQHIYDEHDEACCAMLWG